MRFGKKLYLDGETGVEIVFADRQYETLRTHLLCDPEKEQHAFALGRVNRNHSGVRLLVNEVLLDEEADLLEQKQALVEAHPVRVLEVADRCEAEGLSLVAIHSHPFCRGSVRKSGLDVHSESEIFPWIAQRVPTGCHASLVFGQDSVDGHYWNAGSQSRSAVQAVRVVGEHVRVLPTTSGNGRRQAGYRPDERFDRQVQAFGQAGQSLIETTRVGIIGAGGLGTALTQKLAHLGVRSFVVVDDDRVELSNLNRLVGASRGDAEKRTPKVSVVERTIRQVEPAAVVQALIASVAERPTQEALKHCDVLFGCSDSDGARLIGNELAVRYMIPYFDLGAGIMHEDGVLRAVGGQVWQVVPGGFCLQCTGAIDIAKARVDLMTEVEKRRHLGRGYGTGETAPNVIFLNTLVASLAVQEFSNMLAPFKAPSKMLVYDALKGTVETVRPPNPDPECPVCSARGIRARGDEDEVGQEYQRAVPVMVVSPESDAATSVDDPTDCNDGDALGDRCNVSDLSIVVVSHNESCWFAALGRTSSSGKSRPLTHPQSCLLAGIAESVGAHAIEDCAQALAATINGRGVGTLGDIGVFSLGPRKHLPCGEGGVFVTADAALFQRAVGAGQHPDRAALQVTDPRLAASISEAFWPYRMHPLER